MEAKFRAKPPKGMPRCELKLAPGVTPMGAPLVQILVHALDHHDIGETVVNIHTSVREARAIAVQLLLNADKAEDQAAEQERAKREAAAIEAVCASLE